MAKIFHVQCQSLQESSFITGKIYHDDGLDVLTARFENWVAAAFVSAYDVNGRLVDSVTSHVAISYSLCVPDEENLKVVLGIPDA